MRLRDKAKLYLRSEPPIRSHFAYMVRDAFEAGYREAQRDIAKRLARGNFATRYIRHYTGLRKKNRG